MEEHRVFSYLSEPVRIFGLTIDELLIGMISISLGLMLENLSLKSFFILSGIIGIWFLKRLKKLTVGFSLAGYLHWTFGLRGKLPSFWPASWKRGYLA
jgi:type IV conjugative transfer system protein TraL